MPEPEKTMKDQRATQREELPPMRPPMFSHKGLMVLVAALVLEALAAGLLMNTMVRGENRPAAQPQATQFARQPRAHVALDGPTFSVQTTADTFRTLTVRTIVVELNADLDQTSLKNLEENLRDLNYEIKDALQSIIISEGYQSIMDPKDRQRLQNKLRQEIIRLLGGNVGEKEIKAVLFDTYQILD